MNDEGVTFYKYEMNKLKIECKSSVGLFITRIEAFVVNLYLRAISQGGMKQKSVTETKRRVDIHTTVRLYQRGLRNGAVTSLLYYF